VKRNMVLKDFLKDSYYMRVLEQAIDVAAVEGLAVQTALKEHPVVKFVRELPVENLVCNLPYTESYNRRSPKDDEEKRIDWEKWTGPWEKTSEKYQENLAYVSWSLPMRGEKAKNCGFVRTKDKNGHIMKSCSQDHDHYSKMAKHGCKKLTCPECGPDAILNAGVAIERRVKGHEYLKLQETGYWIQPSHIVVSPPQQFGQQVIQSEESYKEFVNAVKEMLVVAGIRAGTMITHPWRQKSHGWEPGIHVHVVGFGYLKKTKQLKKMFPGWIFEKIHTGEDMRSVRHTEAYLTSHAGIAKAARMDQDIDWERRFLNLMIPEKNLEEDDIDPDIDEDLFEKYGKLLAMPEKHSRNESSKETDHFYQNGQFWKKVNGKWEPPERLAQEDIQMDPQLQLLDVDWEQYTKRAYTRTFTAVRYFGEVSTRGIRVLSEYRERVVRKCPECDSDICSYVVTDRKLIFLEKVEYWKESPVLVRSQNYDTVWTDYLHYKTDLIEDGNTLLDYAMVHPMLATPEAMGLQPVTADGSRERRAEKLKKTIVYEPHPSGSGLKAVAMSRKEARAAKKIGTISEILDFHEARWNNRDKILPG